MDIRCLSKYTTDFLRVLSAYVKSCWFSGANVCEGSSKPHNPGPDSQWALQKA